MQPRGPPETAAALWQPVPSMPGGLLAPVASVVNKAALLGEEVCAAALTIAGGQGPVGLDPSALRQVWPAAEPAQAECNSSGR